MNKYSVTSFILSSTLLFSCGKGGSGGGENGALPVVDNFEMEMEGTYQAILSPLNKTVSGHLNGSLTIVRERNEFIADVRVSDGPLSAIHIQSLHMGERCPTESDDLNKDGFIDAEEGASVYKEILIPLDDDINSQRMGGGTYPQSDEYGYYFWSRVADYGKFKSDLREEDLNPHDDLVTLPHHKSLNMTGKVVIIRGVPETASLPETVATRGRMTKHQALPIACGVLRRIQKVPGVIDTDETGIPVPEGETVGGSGGADDGADFSKRPTDTGNYGDTDEEEEPEIRENSTEFEGNTGRVTGG